MASDEAKSKQFKRLIVLCDGTGQSSDDGHASVPTNIARIARALKPTVVVPAVDADPDSGVEGSSEWEIPQVVLYQNGVGTDGVTWLENTAASAFGWGLDVHVLEAYSFIANNWEYGDQIFIYGFSRGAFTARALSALICNVGLLTKDTLQYLPAIYDKYKLRQDTTNTKDEFSKWITAHDNLFKFQKEVTIYILGVFDTVGSLGVPETTWTNWLKKIPGMPDWNKGYGYHDTSFPVPSGREQYKGFIWKAYQALSLDEDRTSFGPTLLYHPPLKEGEDVPDEGTMIQQTWFPGVHTDVGGGYERAFRDLSDISLAWMMDICRGHLEFYDIRDQLKSTTLATTFSLDEGTKKKTSAVKEGLDWGCSPQHDERNTIKFKAGGQTIRKPGQYFLDKRDPVTGTLKYKTNETIHVSVRYRMMKTGYRPPALKGFKLDKDESGWFWEKKVGKDLVRLDEWAVWKNEIEEDEALEGWLVSEEAVRDLGDEVKSRAIKMVM